MEFLRFGSSIPGAYWGCCACSIIQNFKVDPDQPASIEVTIGDSGDSCGKFAGPTWRDIFWQRLRYGEFSTNDMPNHAFIAILTQSQLDGGYGKQWAEILAEAGFEFVRTVCNSVYSGAALFKEGGAKDSSKNHIFMLVRNIGSGRITDPFTPPKAWSDIKGRVVAGHDMLFADPDAIGALPGGATVALARKQEAFHTKVWNDKGPAKFYTAEELEALGVPVVMAGIRTQFPPTLKATRETQMKEFQEKMGRAPARNHTNLTLPPKPKEAAQVPPPAATPTAG